MGEFWLPEIPPPTWFLNTPLDSDPIHDLCMDQNPCLAGISAWILIDPNSDLLGNISKESRIGFWFGFWSKINFDIDRDPWNHYYSLKYTPVKFHLYIYIITVYLLCVFICVFEYQEKTMHLYMEMIFQSLLGQFKIIFLRGNAFFSHNKVFFLYFHILSFFI